MLRTAKFTRCLSPLNFTRGYARVLSAQFQQAPSASKPKDNDDVLARYREKLQRKAAEVGAKDVSDLMEKMGDKIEQTKKELNKIDPLAELEAFEKAQAGNSGNSDKTRVKKIPEPLKPVESATKVPEAPKIKSLDSFVALDKLSKHTAEEISLIWRARFQADENNMCAVISKQQFDQMYKVARKNPLFILPSLPKEGTGEGDGGTELHYIQWSFVGPNTTHCLMTSLVEYKLHGEFARPHTTLIFHHELGESHGVYLMNGKLEKDSPTTIQDAQYLVMNLQRFYGAGNGGTQEDTEGSRRRERLLRDFNTGSESFSLDDLLAEAKKLIA